MNLHYINQLINQEFEDFSFCKKNFPQLFQPGIANSAVHSAGVSYLLSLGLKFGLPAIAEYPVIVHAENTWKNTPRVMPDAVWFHPETYQPWITFEFERFEKGDELKIEDKVRNLALSYYQANGTIELCVLIYWLRSGIAPRSIDPLLKIFDQGFVINGVFIQAPNCSFSIYKFIFYQNKSITAGQSNNINDDHGLYSVDNNESTKLSISNVTKIK